MSNILLPFSIPFLVTIAVFALIKTLIDKKTITVSEGDGPSQNQNIFLTPAEKSFFSMLENSVSHQARIFAKVKLDEILKPSFETGLIKKTPVFNRIKSKVVDFVVCSHDDLSILGAIDLNPEPNKNSSGKNRGNFLENYYIDNHFASAQIPLLRLSAEKTHSIEEIKTLLVECLVLPPNEQKVESIMENTTNPSCSRCGEKMVKRKVNKGQHAGKKLWACSDFPICREVVAI
ncbi:MAG: DUF2726 domain-containing protein [Deltaproteobacteria bacterium]|nr:DUF2726 domain-containing protein [Deltaproteobacteria bacterium]